jgi:hypothetical protein
VDADAVEAHVEVGVDGDKDEDENAVHNTVAEEVAVIQRDFGSASQAAQAAVAGTSSRPARVCRCSVEDLDVERKFLDKRYGSKTPVHLVKHTEPDELLILKRLFGLTKVALKSFLVRYGKNPWMQAQGYYVQKAALAAAHMRMAVWRSRSTHVDYPGQWCSLRLSTFDGDAFLNCGWSRKTRYGGRYFFKCHQPEYCPSCNYHLRVVPARREFLEAFRSAPLWYSITVMATSHPAKAGVKMFVGYDDQGEEVYEPLVMLRELVDCPRLPKYDSQCAVPYMVAAGLWELMPWMIAGHYFDGLHVAGENDFTYYPDSRSPVGVSHTVNPHFHGYGNTRRPFDRRRALFLLRNALQIMHEEGGGRLWAYPDIALRPILSADEMKKAINYVLKSWNFGQVYIDALARGCPVVGLNLEFQPTYFGSEAILHPFPSSSGLSKWGARLGNMTQRAGKDYIGTPLPEEMSSQQVKRFLERLERGEVWSWETIRYEQHLAIRARQVQRRARQQAKEMEKELPGQATAEGE